MTIEKRPARQFRYGSLVTEGRQGFNLSDAIILFGIAALLYAGLRLAFRSPAVLAGPEINLSPLALPWYATLSVGRMAAAYLLSLLFSLSYGYAAYQNRAARSVLMPALDVLQSVPILSFLPVVLLSLNAVMPERAAAEISSIVLIFTSQAWNMTFSFYQSLSTIPGELKEASAIFRLNRWLRFRKLELPFAAIGLIWNSVMSWSGGWFFLMAAEIFHVGQRDFRLPGLGAYLQTAANSGNLHAVLLGVATLVIVIVLLDQLVWRPLIAWSHKFKVEMVEDDEPPTSWFLDVLSRSWLLARVRESRIHAWGERLDAVLHAWLGDRGIYPEGQANRARPSLWVLGTGLGIAVAIGFGVYRSTGLLLSLPAATWRELLHGVVATFCRVGVALFVALLWTVPLGVAIGTNRRLANILQPLVQVIAAVPATALFPVVLLAFLHMPGGLNIAAILLMMMGTQWYLLFNVIAGASSIPVDLIHTTKLLQLSPIDRWRTLILPALFPYIITGAVTAGGGAWNASIVAEYVEFGGHTHSTVGAGALIARATATSNYSLLLAATLALVLSVVLINRLLWRRLYRLAERRYHLD